MEIDEAIKQNPASDREQGEAATAVTVKGWRNGLLILLPADIPLNALFSLLDGKLDEAQATGFWRGAQTTLDLGARALTLTGMRELLDHLKGRFGLVPIAAVATDNVTREAAARCALTVYDTLPTVRRSALPVEAIATDQLTPPTDPAESTAEEPVQTEATPISIPIPRQEVGSELGGGNALYLSGTVRSGQRVVHGGSIVIGGDVNAGAELVANGDIVVFGTLRGVAHAGASGDEGAKIMALHLRPTQLRIAGRIARAPEESRRGNRRAPTGKDHKEELGAEVARIVNGEIEVLPA